MPTIPLIFTNYPGLGDVVTVPQFEHAAMEDDKPAVARSSIYALIKTKKMLFTRGVDFLFYADLEGGGEVFNDFIEKYSHIRGAYITQRNRHLLTREGVEKICRHWDIDPETLRSRKEVPKDAPVQNKLLPTKEDELAKLFRSGKGLASTAKHVDVEKPTTIDVPKNYRVYARDFPNRQEQVVLGINYNLSSEVSKFKEVSDHITGKSTNLRAQIYVQGADVIIRFVDGTVADALTLRRTVKDGVLSNVAVRKSSYSGVLMDTLLAAGIHATDTRNIDVYPEINTVVAHF